MVLKLKSIFTDSLWTICGLILMNIVAQFIVYPAWNNLFGSEEYGEILYLLSLMNTYAISVGSACNYIRITESRNGEDSTASYILILVVASIMAIPVTVGIKIWGGITMHFNVWCSYFVLMVTTMWRFYADVEYRLSLNYKGYFYYYLIISIGYVCGIYLSSITNIWPLALLPGEIFGLIWVYFKGKTLHWDYRPNRTVFISVCKSTILLVIANTLSNVIFNGDRILLNSAIDGNAVTMYYLASLLGKTISLVTTPLSSIIISYLVRIEVKLDRKLMHYILIGSLGIIALATLACIVGSWIIVPYLYPEEYLQVKPYFLVASATQALYFITGMIMVILLRFCDSKYQLIINIVYTVSFLIICIPLTVTYGFSGFCVGVLSASMIRYLFALGLGYLIAKQ